MNGEKKERWMAALDGETARQSGDRNSGRLNRKPFM
jgi:hypothetical protein